MGKLFGTDGVRGLVNQELTAGLALKLGVSIAQIMKQKLKKDSLTFVIGTDTRESKDMLSSAITAGILSEGCNIIDVGIFPTPGIAYLVKKYQTDGGIIISASHNPSEYNGIKVLNNQGFKLSDTIEEEIEEIMPHIGWSNKNKVGTYEQRKEAINTYVDYLAHTIDHSLEGLKILVDTANGAAYETANLLFQKLNASYTLFNNEPNGTNINQKAGSTHIEGLQEKVKEGSYDIGIAYDGDADRCILVDELGNEIDGDYILAITGKSLKEKNQLDNNTIVGTVMSNLGLIKFCEKENIHFVKTKVGDKYVLEEMLKMKDCLGGEQSGHIIFSKLASTGDGELTSLQILNIMQEKKEKLSNLAKIMEKYPQVMINVAVSPKGKEDYPENQKIQEMIKQVEKELKEEGRVLVRPSGTENLIRVMIEGKDKEMITTYCRQIAQTIEEELNEQE